MESISITEELKALATTNKNAVLLGVADELGVALLGCAYCAATTSDLQDVADLVPAPIGVMGAFGVTKEEALQASVQVLKSGLGPGVCIAAFAVSGELRAARVHPDGTCGPDVALDRVSSFEEWSKQYFALRCELPLKLEVVEDAATAASTALQVAFSSLVRQLEAPGLSFLAEAGPSGRSSAALLRPGDPGTWVALNSGGSNGSSSGGGFSVTSCSPLVDTTRLAAPPSGLTFAFSPLAGPSGGGGGTATCLTATLQLDVLCFVRRGCKQGAAAEALSRAIVRQLQAAHRVLAGQAGGKVLPVRAYHFLPPGLGHPLTLLYPALVDDPERNDDRLVPRRQRLHALLGLPPNRPMLRSANAVDPGAGPGGEEGGSGGSGPVARLRDVHLGLAAPGIGGSPVLVQGSYEYCHYMQDRFNDSGWGCAYRSLQTICSWFRLQKYTSKPIPSHKTIQQVLVRLGDKPPSFVGSSQWIGAIELSYILDDYLGVTSKILTVNRGSDIPSHARELAAHFATVGSPVMIGGGVLAYTLLGVRFNEQTGEAAFLILDPHYTGGEDLKKIQQGTWVGWKRPGDNAAAGGPLFVDDAFYNFLLPQRPDTV